MAVVPFESFAGGAARPGVMAEVARQLAARGVEVVAGEEVEAFLEAGRIRYLDSLTSTQARELAAATRADALLVGSILAVEEPLAGQGPVAAALHAALVSSEGEVLWQNLVALTGDETENALGLGRIRELQPLLREAAGRLLAPMPLPPARVRVARVLPRRGLPRVYRAPGFRAGDAPICVLPLQDLAEGAAGGGGVRTVTALLQRRLSERAGLRVVAPADLRAALVAARLPSPLRMSAEELKRLGSALQVRHFLVGAVLGHQGSAVAPGGAAGAEVEVHLSLVDAEAGRVIWSGLHRRNAAEFRGLLGRNAVTSLHAVADRVVTELVEAFLRS